jgi:hypothetical protein
VIITEKERMGDDETANSERNKLLLRVTLNRYYLICPTTRVRNTLDQTLATVRILTNQRRSRNHFVFSAK